MWRVTCGVVVALGAVASAEPDGPAFARSFAVAADHVKGVTGFGLRTGNFTRVVVGHYDELAGIALVRCEASQCTDRTNGFGTADTVEVAGIVDLNGAPTALRDSAIGALPETGMKYPVLAVRITTHREHETHAELALISLLDGDLLLRGSLEDRYPNGGGSTTRYRVVRGDGKGVTLELVATNQRDLDQRHSHCLQPKPTEQHYRLVDGHFQAYGELPRRTGC